MLGCVSIVVEAEERKRLETENKAIVAEQLEKTKLDVQHEKAEIQVCTRLYMYMLSLLT